jgi:hypothetical protein
VVRWVGVSGGKFELEGFLEDDLDEIHDVAAVLDGECAVLLSLAGLWRMKIDISFTYRRTEVFLHVDDRQSGILAEFGHGDGCRFGE